MNPLVVLLIGYFLSNREKSKPEDKPRSTQLTKGAQSGRLYQVYALDPGNPPKDVRIYDSATGELIYAVRRIGGVSVIVDQGKAASLAAQQDARADFRLVEEKDNELTP